MAIAPALQTVPTPKGQVPGELEAGPGAGRVRLEDSRRGFLSVARSNRETSRQAQGGLREGSSRGLQDRILLPVPLRIPHPIAHREGFPVPFAQPAGSLAGVLGEHASFPTYRSEGRRWSPTCIAVFPREPQVSPALGLCPLPRVDAFEDGDALLQEPELESTSVLVDLGEVGAGPLHFPDLHVALV